jgi:nucleotide-binding universal stress UspA family protein
MRILCATDLLPKSDAAMERAGILADQLGADLTLLHVVVPGESQQALEQTLQWASAEMRLRVRPPRWRARSAPNVAVSTGGAAKTILDTATESQAGLLVLGPHRERPLRDALEGTLAEKALVTGSYPVLVVRGAAAQPYRRLLLALDGSEASIAALRATESFVLTPDVEATVVHAHKPPYEGMMYSSDVGTETIARYAENWRRDAHHTVRELLNYESNDAARYYVHVEPKLATPGILKAIEYFSPDLLVMGTRGGSRLRRALVGSVANRILHETSCDVLIVPEGSFGASRSKVMFGGGRYSAEGSRGMVLEIDRRSSTHNR